MQKSYLFTIIFLTALMLTSCASLSDSTDTGELTAERVAVAGGEYSNISVPILESMLENEDFTFVNVHIPFGGDIPNTDVSIAYNEIEANLDLLPADKDSTIVLYCRSGSMSRTASETLVGLGYTNILNLEGGFNAWRDAGHPIEGLD